MKIKKGDNVIVIAGKDKGQKGKVLQAFPDEEKVLIEGVNVKKRHQRPTRQNQKGQIVDKSMPVHVSNVAFVDPKTSKPTRIGYKIENYKKVRIARKSGTSIA
jgi:large subunit ribosomal protein L24